MSGENGAPFARLLVNADDFGVSERVDEGIAQAHSRGIVTATSLMAVGRSFEHAVGLWRELPTLDVGVHLTLVGERPLLTSSSLVTADGRFPADAAALLRRCLAGAIRLVEVEAEWAAQIERVLSTGIRPSHLDSHQHVHVLPGLAGIAQRLARRYGIPRLRLPLEHPPAAWPARAAELKRLAGLAALWFTWGTARLTGAASPVGPRLNFLGFMTGGRLDEQALLRLVVGMRAGRDYELMCHPGLAPTEPDLLGWHYSHEEELRALTSPRVQDELAARGIRLTRFSEL